MLSIGRALMTHPELIILDEATEGLAPLIVADIWRVIGEIRASGIATLIVDRDYRRVLARSDRAIVCRRRARWCWKAAARPWRRTRRWPGSWRLIRSRGWKCLDTGAQEAWQARRHVPRPVLAPTLRIRHLLGRQAAIAAAALAAILVPALCVRSRPARAG